MDFTDIITRCSDFYHSLEVFRMDEYCANTHAFINISHFHTAMPCGHMTSLDMFNTGNSVYL